MGVGLEPNGKGVEPDIARSEFSNKFMVPVINQSHFIICSILALTEKN